MVGTSSSSTAACHEILILLDLPDTIQGTLQEGELMSSQYFFLIISTVNIFLLFHIVVLLSHLHLVVTVFAQLLSFAVKFCAACVAHVLMSVTECGLCPGWLAGLLGPT